jgi:hypothetical protein
LPFTQFVDGGFRMKPKVYLETTIISYLYEIPVVCAPLELIEEHGSD